MKFKVEINGGGNALTSQLMAEARKKLEAALDHMAAEHSARAMDDGHHRSSRRANRQLRRGARAAIASTQQTGAAASDSTKPSLDSGRDAP